MSRHLLLSAIAFGLAAPAVSAQQLDRRNRDEPEVVVEAGGRFGTCDAMRFSADGRFLFAAGDDKVVRVWPHLKEGLVSELGPGQAQTLRWRAWREQRGGIKAIDMLPDGSRVAVGGYGMKPASVALIDRPSGNTLAITWPISRNGIDNFNVVMAIAFHPDGRRIGFGTADGSLWLWDPQKLDAPTKDGRTWSAPVRVGKHAPFKDPAWASKPNYPRFVFFPDANTLTSVAESGQVASFTLGNNLSENPAVEPPKPARQFDINDGKPTITRVYRADLTRDRKSLVLAVVAPVVLVQPLDGGKPTEVALPKKDTYPRSIAVHPQTGQLAVAVAIARKNEARFYSEESDTILLFPDPTAGKVEVSKQITHTGPAEALAFHPTEPRLAVAGGDADEVKLLDLDRPEAPLTVVRGAGRRIWGVNISENGNLIGVQGARNPLAESPNARGAGAWARFDAPRLKPTRDAGQKWVDPLSTVDGWRVEPDPNDRFVWYAVLERGGAEAARHRLSIERKAGQGTDGRLMDRDQDQAPTCYTFLPARDGKPTRLLIGHLYGCSLFELRREAAVRTKLFTGHSGEVLSVVAHPTQNWFVTGGSDHTLSAYTLDDWPANPGLGAEFAVQNGQVVVTKLDVGSPAWEAGLTPGDTLDLLAVGGNKIVYDRRPSLSPLGQPADAMAALKNPVPGQELYFGLVPAQNKARRETGTTVRQRPLWKWFPAFSDDGQMNDWVVWMWKGSYYHTTSAHGDSMIGWHVNAPEVDGKPVFYKLEQFKDRYHKLAVMQKLVTSRSVAEALKLLGNDDPPPGTFGRYEPEPIQFLVDRSVVDPTLGANASISVRPRGTNPDRLPVRVELWMNDHRMMAWPDANGKPLDPTKPFETKVTIPARAFRAGENKLSVLTFAAGGGRAEEQLAIFNEKPASTPNLHALSIGINDYSRSEIAMLGVGKRGGLTNLNWATKDAAGLADKLDLFRGKNRYYADGRIVKRLDGEARREQLLKDLAAVKDQVQPDDLLVVFFAGHGDLPGAKRGEPEPGTGRGAILDPGPFVFCCPDYTDLNVAKTALSADDLFNALAGVNCRKVVLLDACHAGGAADANVLRRFIPNGQGPFVIAACDQSELSYEDSKVGPLKHGLFTQSLLEALGDRSRKADTNSDGVLTADEIYRYVSVRVPELVPMVAPGDTQTPICFPRQPPRFVVVKM